LLDRLAGEDEGKTYTSLAAQHVDADAYIRSIKANIGRILNERRGSSPATPDYGLADFNDGATESDDMSKYIMADIRRCIMSFEPRVSAVDVRALPGVTSPLDLTYELKLAVPGRDGDDPLQFEVHLGQGVVRVL